MRSGLCVCIVAVGLAAVASGADSAGKAYEEGLVALRAGQLQDALVAFTKAAKAEPENQEYREQALLVRRVIRTHELLADIEDTTKRVLFSRGLHAFYHENEAYRQALKVDRALHERLDNAESAELLARTQLALNQSAQAAEVIAGVAPADRTPALHALHALALARQGNHDAACNELSQVNVPDGPASELQFDLACTHALLGNTDAALSHLRNALEQTPPSQIERCRTQARTCADLRTARGQKAFNATLKTESKIKESDCSGGTSCGNCPSRSSCGSKADKGD